jgi:hypothetical protein
MDEYGGVWWKFHVLMYENGTMRQLKLFKEKGEKGRKENEGESEPD